MKNLNKVKGTASKMEAMMRQDKKEMKILKCPENTNDGGTAVPSTTNSDENNVDCDDNDKADDDLNCICELNKKEVPTLKDINKIINESQVLENNEQSRQLFLLIKLFIDVRGKLAEEETQLPPVQT